MIGCSRALAILSTFVFFFIVPTQNSPSAEDLKTVQRRALDCNCKLGGSRTRHSRCNCYAGYQPRVFIVWTERHRWVVIASRKELAEGIAIAEKYAEHNSRVVKSQNGWVRCSARAARSF